ncbi:MAG: glycosyltransferase [Parasphingorhabdus sp.]|nr:glycosyltransferase [Parasphingorhabdus sp.]
MKPSADDILVIFHDLSAGGTELVGLKLAQQWARAGRRVTLLCGALHGPLRDQLPPEIRVEELDPPITRSLTSRWTFARRLPVVIDRLKPDIVFLPGNYHLILGRGVARSQVAPPVVAKISNPIVPGGNMLVRKIGKRVFRWSAKHVDWFAAMSSGLADDVRAATGYENVSTIFDPNVDAENVASSRKAPVDPSQPMRLLAAGRLVAQKDFALAIRVTAALTQRRDVHLNILGEGPDRPALERLARQLGIGDRVRMPGRAESIFPALADADILLVTSRYEGGPAVAVEALAQAVPVVATDCSHFLRDLMHDPAYGELVTSRDPAHIAAAVERTYDAIGRPGFDPTVATAPYRTETASAAYLALFDRLVASQSA